MGLERDWQPESATVGKNPVGNFITSAGDKLGEVLGAVGGQRHELKLAQINNEHALTHIALQGLIQERRDKLQHEQLGQTLESAPMGTTRIEKSLGDASTTISISGKGKGTHKIASESPSASEGAPTIAKAVVTKHVKDMLEVKGLGKKADPTAHARIATNYGKLVGKYGQRVVDQAIKNHPLIKGAK
jgi:hypothetical protein